jgi:hypothetical protein
VGVITYQASQCKAPIIVDEPVTEPVVEPVIPEPEPVVDPVTPEPVIEPVVIIEPITPANNQTSSQLQNLTL